MQESEQQELHAMETAEQPYMDDFDTRVRNTWNPPLPSHTRLEEGAAGAFTCQTCTSFASYEGTAVLHVRNDKSNRWHPRYGSVTLFVCNECSECKFAIELPAWFNDEYSLEPTQWGDDSRMEITPEGMHFYFKPRRETRQTATKRGIEEALMDSDIAFLALHTGPGVKTRKRYYHPS